MKTDRTGDKVAEAVGMSGKTYEKTKGEFATLGSPVGNLARAAQGT